jgi:hypothetical protein
VRRIRGGQSRNENESLSPNASCRISRSPANQRSEAGGNSTDWSVLTVIAEGAAKVSWVTVASGEGSAPRWLQDGTDQPNAFECDAADIADLAETGQIKFRSYDADDEEIDATSIYFVRGCLPPTRGA